MDIGDLVEGYDFEGVGDNPSYLGLSYDQQYMKYISERISMYATYIEKHRSSKIYFYDCDVCGCSFVSRKPRGAHKYCSDDCRYKNKKHKEWQRAYDAEKYKTKRQCRVYFKNCEVCGDLYTAKKRNQKFCSAYCRRNESKKVKARKTDYAINKNKYNAANKLYRKEHKKRLYARKKELRDKRRIVLTMQERFERDTKNRSKYGISGIEMTKYSYRVAIYVNSKRRSLGTYDDYLDACCARKSAEAKIIAGMVL